MKRHNLFITLLIFAAMFTLAIPSYAQTHNGHAYVNLGLPSGTLWATCNIGASSPEEYGDYYAWAETTPKQEYSNTTYSFITEDGSYIRYNYKDHKTELDLADDAAHVNWGGNWHLPSLKQCQELIDNCTWTWSEEKHGSYVKSNTNDNYIFLPATGHRLKDGLYMVGSAAGYWSRSLNADAVQDAYYLGIKGNEVDFFDYNRYHGHALRPVCTRE